MPRNQNDFTYDNATLMKDAGAITADAPAQVGAVNRILTLGAGRADFRVILDVSALDVSSLDEKYDLRLQFSNSPTFASGVIGGPIVELGAAAVLIGESAASVVGRYELAASNEINGTLYSYARMYTDVTGTTPSINYTAYMVQDG